MVEDLYLLVCNFPVPPWLTVVWLVIGMDLHLWKFFVIVVRDLYLSSMTSFSNLDFCELSVSLQVLMSLDWALGCSRIISFSQLIPPFCQSVFIVHWEVAAHFYFLFVLLFIGSFNLGCFFYRTFFLRSVCSHTLRGSLSPCGVALTIGPESFVHPVYTIFNKSPKGLFF